MSFNLIVHIPDQEPVLYELNADRIGVGRTADNQIQINIETISSAHFELRRRDDDYEIVDLESKNGVRVNGLSVNAPIPLADGDRLLIGETVPAFFVELSEGEEVNDAVKTGSTTVQRSAANYVALDDKVQELEQKLESIRSEFQSKQNEYDELIKSIEEIQSDIKTMSSSGADPEDIKAMESDLLVKTRRVTVLKSDIVDTEKELADLEKTAKTTLRAPMPNSSAPAAPPAPAPPSAPPSGPAVAPPKKPPAAPSLPPAAAPKKPPTFKKPE